MEYILNRAKEKSTWLGILSLATAFGVSINPELASAIITAAVSLAGVLALVLKDKTSADHPNTVVNGK